MDFLSSAGTLGSGSSGPGGLSLPPSLFGMTSSSASSDRDQERGLGIHLEAPPPPSMLDRATSIFSGGNTATNTSTNRGASRNAARATAAFNAEYGSEAPIQRLHRLGPSRRVQTTDISGKDVTRVHNLAPLTPEKQILQSGRVTSTPSATIQSDPTGLFLNAPGSQFSWNQFVPQSIGYPSMAQPQRTQTLSDPSPFYSPSALFDPTQNSMPYSGPSGSGHFNLRNVASYLPQILSLLNPNGLSTGANSQFINGTQVSGTQLTGPQLTAISNLFPNSLHGLPSASNSPSSQFAQPWAQSLQQNMGQPSTMQPQTTQISTGAPPFSSPLLACLAQNGRPVPPPIGANTPFGNGQQAQVQTQSTAQPQTAITSNPFHPSLYSAVQPTAPQISNYANTQQTGITADTFANFQGIGDSTFKMNGTTYHLPLGMTVQTMNETALPDWYTEHEHERVEWADKNRKDMRKLADELTGGDTDALNNEQIDSVRCPTEKSAYQAYCERAREDHRDSFAWSQQASVYNEFEKPITEPWQSQPSNLDVYLKTGRKLSNPDGSTRPEFDYYTMPASVVEQARSIYRRPTFSMCSTLPDGGRDGFKSGTEIAFTVDEGDQNCSRTRNKITLVELNSQLVNGEFVDDDRRRWRIRTTDKTDLTETRRGSWRNRWRGQTNEDPSMKTCRINLLDADCDRDAEGNAIPQSHTLRLHRLPTPDRTSI